MRPVYALLAFFLSSSVSQAADRSLSCRVGVQQGTANIKVMQVEGHPELLMLDLDLHTKLTRHASGLEGQVAHLSGLMSATIAEGGSLFASGLMASSPSGAIINPELVSLQGEIKEDGSIQGAFYDEDRMIQLGFGIGVTCVSQTPL